jgi:hypothetical protein
MAGKWHRIPRVRPVRLHDCPSIGFINLHAINTGLPPRMKKPEAPSKIQEYREKEHVFFADLLKAKLHRFHRARQTYPTFKAQQEERVN